jgi:hypothetical protein
MYRVFSFQHSLAGERYPPIRTEDFPTQSEARERKLVLQRAGRIACVTPAPAQKVRPKITYRRKPRYAGSRPTFYKE